MKLSTAQILSLTTGRLVCKMESLYEIANALTGDSLYTHQLLRAAKVCRPWLDQQCPWLATVDASECDTDNWRTWLAAIVERVGAEHEVAPLPAGIWESQDPITELARMVGENKLTVVGMAHRPCPLTISIPIDWTYCEDGMPDDDVRVMVCLVDDTGLIGDDAEWEYGYHANGKWWQDAMPDEAPDELAVYAWAHIPKLPPQRKGGAS